MWLHALLGLAWLSRISSAANPPIVDLGYIKYAGYNDPATGLNSFKGIRYAQPPLGDLRFRAPVPYDNGSTYPSSEPVDASRTPNQCWQSAPIALVLRDSAAGFDPSNPQGSEDCLFLTVVVPESPAKPKLPVVVFIHGGGYTQGNGDLYSGEAITHASDGNMIFVSIQYRLGMFGFLAGAEVAKDGIKNAGIRDQRLAIEWVAKYIDRFGGDPDMVTIWGGSAGGGSVSFHMTSYGGAGSVPFSGAIVDYPWWTPMLTDSLQEAQYQCALQQVGCADLACLRGQDSTKLALANQAVLNDSYPSPGYGFGTFYWGPVVDGDYVPDLLSRSFETGRFHKVPLLTGRDTYEGWVFSNTSQTTVRDETIDAQRTFPSAGRDFFAQLYSVYPREAYNSTFVQRQTWFGDMIVDCPTLFAAQASTRYLSNSSSVFKMIWNANGGTHASDTPFLFSTGPSFSGTTDQNLAIALSSYFISFIRFHDPNPERSLGATFWPSYNQGGPVGEVIQIDPDNKIFAVPDPDGGPTCKFWGEHNEIAMH